MISHGLVCVYVCMCVCVHEQKSGHFREDGEISASLNKSDVILFQNVIITNKQANYIVPL